jgi:exopolysaccharide biosynthesis WecB/TagA/CpsF family protein
MGDNLPIEAAVESGQEFRWPRKVDLLGVQVSVTTYEEAAAVILQAASRGVSGLVSCHAVHAIVTASREPSLRAKVNTFSMVTADGQPVRWALNLLHRARLSERVYGPELMLRLCQGAAAAGVPIYLYGGNTEVAGRLETEFRHLWPGLQIAGSESPPFRALTPDEDRSVVDRINRSGARLVFVGLGCPKQDLFAYEHRHTIKAVQVCVGAAFDFHAGVKKMAPRWMQRRGMEWLYRLAQEPRRLWRRYLVTNSLFVAKVGRALLVRGGELSRRKELNRARARLQPVGRRHVNHTVGTLSTDRRPQEVEVKQRLLEIPGQGLASKACSPPAAVKESF